MKRALVCLSFAACSPARAPATVSLALPLPTASISPVSEVRHAPFAQEMDFSSDQGPIHLVKDGDRFAGTYPNGVMSCTVKAETFTCHWYQQSGEGTAKLRREGDRLEGTWDDDAEDDETLPVPRGAVTRALDGSWQSNWGQATFTTKGQNVHIDYDQGTVDCTQRDRNLACTWQEGGTSGGADLVIESSWIVRGRWGTGTSNTDGGIWMFVRRR